MFDWVRIVESFGLCVWFDFGFCIWIGHDFRVWTLEYWVWL